MANLWYGHFNSTPDDPRKLQAHEWARYNMSFITDGIRNGGTCLQVTADSGMVVKVDVGVANVQGYIMRIDEDYEGRYYKVLVPEAHPQYPRIDRLVLRLDLDTNARCVKPVILHGTAAASPAAPPLTRDAKVWELSLAQIRVNAGTLAVTAGNITDERFNTELCGLINSVLGLDPSAWQAQFDAFMALIEADNAAAALEFRQMFDGNQAQFRREFDDRQTARQEQWDAWFKIFEDWKNLTVSELAMQLSFALDNQFAFPGTVMDCDDSDPDTMRQTLRWTATGDVFCEHIAVFSEGGTVITETQKVYRPDGGLFRAVRMVTTFTGGMPRSEVTTL